MVFKPQLYLFAVLFHHDLTSWSAGSKSCRAKSTQFYHSQLQKHLSRIDQENVLPVIYPKF